MNRNAASSILFVAFCLAGCGASNDQNVTAQYRKAEIHSAPGSGERRGRSRDLAQTTKRLLDAAEPFEALTETAFHADRAKRDKEIDAARSAVKNVEGWVPQNVMTDLDRNLEAIAKADVADNRTDLALASIANYRVLVSAVPGTPVVPIDVSLLDYAGFRFDADAQAPQPRWDDMSSSLAFARQRWAGLADRPPVAGIAHRVEAALTAMELAVRAKNVGEARKAAKAELDLVDVLEAAFERAGRSGN